VLGDRYTIVDMAVWGWAHLMAVVLGDEAWDDLPHLKRLIDEISNRPAGIRALELKDRHKFKMEMDEEATRYMFPSIGAET
jgi:GST-like protein